MFGWPLFVGIICDADLSTLDQIVNKAVEEFGDPSDDIQVARNFCGFISDQIVGHYNQVKINCVEGVAVCAYWDKCFISSCFGDLMTHTKCVMEFYSILNMMTNI
jgi:hypothetical protein